MVLIWLTSSQPAFRALLMSDHLEPIRPNERSPRFGQSTGAEGRADRFRASLDERAGGGGRSGREPADRGADRGDRGPAADAVAWTAPRRALLLLLRESVLSATARVLRLPTAGAAVGPSTAAYANNALHRLDVEPPPTVDQWLQLVRSEQHTCAGPRRVGDDAVGPWSIDRIERALTVAMRRGVEAAVRTFGAGLGVEAGESIGLFDVLSARLPLARRQPPSTTSS